MLRLQRTNGSCLHDPNSYSEYLLWDGGSITHDISASKIDATVASIFGPSMKNPVNLVSEEVKSLKVIRRWRSQPEQYQHHTTTTESWHIGKTYHQQYTKKEQVCYVCLETSLLYKFEITWILNFIAMKQ